MNNPPAFPVVGMSQLSGGQQIDAVFERGMTLRDYFATKAMQGFCANPGSSFPSHENLAEQAYKQADAMLKARDDQAK